MARTFAEEIVELSSTPGTGDYTLAGPKGNYFPFSASFTTGDKPAFVVRNRTNTKVEYNRGGALTLGPPDTLARGVWKSTNGDAAVSWTSDDLPLTITIPSSAELHEGVVTGWLATARHALLRAGAMFFTTADVAVSWVHKLAIGDSTEARVAFYDAVKEHYFPDSRRRFVDNGAANLVMTAEHIGQTIKFDVSAAARTMTLLDGTVDGVGAGFPFYVLPYGGNNCVSLIPAAGDGIDGGADAVPVPLPAGRITAVWWDDVAGGWQTDLAAGLIPAPGGRLTLETGVSVSTADQTAKTVVYYTPHRNNFAVLRAGAGFSMYPFSELSNDLTQSATGKAGPAAAGPYQVIDLFKWSDAGTIRLTRGPKWTKSASFTVTIATPAVITCNSHGLHDGATWRPTATTGALPTGMAVGTDYFVSRIDANTFNISTTLANQVAGTLIATTGSQSGVHTGENYTVERGTGAGTTEHDIVKGIRVNKVAIANGPAAGQGVYVGSIYTNGSSQVDFKRGGLAAAGDAAVIGLWNQYQRVPVAGFIGDTDNSWTYVPTQPRPAHGSPTIRVTVIAGAREDYLQSDYKALHNDGGATGYCAVGHNSSTTVSGRPGYFPPSALTFSDTATHSAQPFGLAYSTALEFGDGSGTQTWFGDNGGSGIQSGKTYRWNY
ncbi:MAG: hypothetical protein K9G48_08635 [Reyranella sp.]|nr:hypothetical protein [Reyranella sp.]